MHFFKKYKLLLIPIMAIFILCMIFIRSFMPPKDLPDHLDLLYLDNSSNSSPLFRMHPQQTYYLDVTTDALKGNLENKSHESVHKSEPSPSTVLTKQSDRPADRPEPSLTDRLDLSLINVASNMPLHLLINIEHPTTDIDYLITQLETSEKYMPAITLSLLPNNMDMSDETYIELAHRIYEILETHNLNKVELILYPKSIDSLSLYDLEWITNIGVLVQSTADIPLLTKIYEHFSDSATLYVRDAISHFYEGDAKKAVQEINTIYYLLATEYPKINTIFSPYRTHSLFPMDEYYLDSSSTDYTMLCTTYYQLATKNWITFSNDPVSNESPYHPLESYSVLSDQVEIILAPTSDLLCNIPGQAGNHTDATYLTYKLDELMIPVQAYYPYLLNLDTTQYANGISRIKASSYNPSNEFVETQSVDIEISNLASLTRSNRISDSYSTNAKAIYKGDYIPILMYHSILDSVSEDEQNSCVETTVFESQIKGLVDAGYTPINFKTLKDYTDGIGGLPEKPILITMDDGYINNYVNAYPIYQKYGVQATLFVSPFYMSEENTERHFGWNAAREMEASGLIDIQSHGYNHTPFPYMSLKDLQYQISHSFGVIEKNLGTRDVHVVACPEFRNTIYTRKLLTSLDIDFQITKLAKPGTVLTSSSLKRINVPNTMSADELISNIESLTM